MEPHRVGRAGAGAAPRFDCDGSVFDTAIQHKKKLYLFPFKLLTENFRSFDFFILLTILSQLGPEQKFYLEPDLRSSRKFPPSNGIR
jgi:hypothetical protein